MFSFKLFIILAILNYIFTCIGFEAFINSSNTQFSRFHSVLEILPCVRETDALMCRSRELNLGKEGQ